MESVQKMKADLGLLPGLASVFLIAASNPIPDVCIESKCGNHLISFHAGCEPVQLAIPAKYAGQFKISDAAVGEDDEQQDYYITSLLKAIEPNIWHRSINKC